MLLVTTLNSTEVSQVQQGKCGTSVTKFSKHMSTTDLLLDEALATNQHDNICIHRTHAVSSG